MATCVEQVEPATVSIGNRTWALLRKKLSTLRTECSRFGIGAAFRLVADKVGSRVLGLKVSHVVWLDVEEVVVTAASLPKFAFRFLNAAEVAAYARDPANDLDNEFVARAADGRNSCFAALDGDRIAAYGWYARDWIEGEHCDGFGLKMPPDVVYMYKGFTHPDYRGQRLHGAVMGLALRAFAENGVKALISTVEWTNDASLKSCARLGYRRIGVLARARFLSIPWWKTSSKVRERGVEIITPTVAARKLTIV
ncbi:MAG: GNAT family N-acetyltransferase [Planctomycetaceae bacterium]|nr:GNAT family N-acetyltransferase [Planctomycetaceae bacterium]